MSGEVGSGFVWLVGNQHQVLEVLVLRALGLWSRFGSPRVFVLCVSRLCCGSMVQDLRVCMCILGIHLGVLATL